MQDSFQEKLNVLIKLEDISNQAVYDMNKDWVMTKRQNDYVATRSPKD